MATDPSPASIFAADKGTGSEGSIFPGDAPVRLWVSGGDPEQCARSGGCLWLRFAGFVHPSILLGAPAPRANIREAGSFGKAAAEGRDGSCCCPRRGKLQPQLGPCWMREHPCAREPSETAPGRRRQAQAGAGRRTDPRWLVSIGNQAAECRLSSRLGAEELFVLFLSSRY